ncbi:MAG: hypothetical protein HY777_12445, partial [Betaproteobacteria bacterium]|nr:hypothetical protein [Betaproteobacteria bacterium]
MRRWIEVLVVVLAVAGLLPAAAPAQGSGFAPITEPQAHPALNLPDMDGKTIDL